MQYIKKVNKIEAIQNKGNILTDVIPFLNERGVPYKYTESFLRGSQIGVITNKDNFEREEYSQLNPGDYLVIDKGVISIMSAADFESKYQLSNEVLNGSQQKEIDELKSNVELLLKAQSKDGEHTAKQPHVRIEFDDIRDVPKVWVDGDLISGVDDKPLVSLNIDWKTNTATENHKGFDVSYFDMTDGCGKSTGFHEGSVM